MEYIATAIFSTRVGEDSWRVVSAHKKLDGESRIQDIFDWVSEQRVTTLVRIELSKVDD